MLLSMCQSAEKVRCAESSHRARHVAGNVSVSGDELEHGTSGIIVRV
jgi:hypothetical protein